MYDLKNEKNILTERGYIYTPIWKYLSPTEFDWLQKEYEKLPDYKYREQHEVAWIDQLEGVPTVRDRDADGKPFERVAEFVFEFQRLKAKKNALMRAQEKQGEHYGNKQTST